ncbi:MAG: FAD-dependent oxidoreductase, partial [Bacteroidota bacterium]
HLTKGVHLVVPHDKLPIKQAIYFDVPDGRMIFAIPRGKVTYIGTTDTSYYGDKNHIVTNTEDAEYLLKAVNDFFPTIHLTEDDVVSSWAGVRPLIHEEGKSESELSRKDEIFESETGLLSIAGGKLTGYRKMAERIVDLVGKRIRKEEDRNIKDCFTNKIPLTDSGFDGEKDVKAYRKGLSKQFESYGLEKGDVRYLVANYGKQCDIIFDYFKSIEEQDVRLRMLKAECKFCVEHELTHTLEDFYSRRTGRLYFDIESAEKYFKEIADVMKGYFNWTEERLQKEIKEMGQAIHEASNFEPDVQS